MNMTLLRFLETQENMTVLLEYMNDGFMLINDRKEIAAINPAFERMTGYVIYDIKGMNPSFLRSRSTSSAIYDRIWKKLDDKKRWQGELSYKHKNGTLFWAVFTMIAVEQEEETYYIGIMRDVSEQKRCKLQLEYKASHDAVTGLPNQAYFREVLKQKIKIAEEKREQVAVLFLDIDHFKKINDSYGHQAGDSLLIQFAKRVNDTLGTRGFMSRFGGDEFTISLFPVRSKREIDQVFQDIFTELERPFIVKGQEFYITISVGWCLFPDHGADAHTLMKNADTAMYKMKANGRNDITMYDQMMNESAADELFLRSELIEAFHRNELEVHYQLQVNIDDRSPFGVEALIRWNHPTKQMLSPAIFLPLAESAGIMAQIDEWVLYEACRQIKGWHKRGYGELVVSVNISKRFFELPDFMERVVKVLKETDLPPKYLCIEIPEHTALLHIDDIRNKLKTLKQYGISISLDDFGTGYSSLSQLSLFPIDILKIDQSFIQNEASKENLEIIKLIINMAQQLDVEVICEGIETEHQLKIIFENGCRCAQGFLFSKPVPAAVCERLMKNLSMNRNR